MMAGWVEALLLQHAEFKEQGGPGCGEDDTAAAPLTLEQGFWLTLCRQKLDCLGQ